MTAGALFAIFGVGIGVGFLSGLMGIGGGVLVVPFLYFFYAHPAWFGVDLAPDLATVVAHATSLFVIVPTSMRGAWSYHRSGLVAWKAAAPIAAAAVLAAVAGAQLASAIPAATLRLAFGVLLVASGLRLGWYKAARDVGREPRLTLPRMVGIGLVVGLFSALLGVGGGIIAIPLLIYGIGLDMARVAGTSLGIIALTAVAGVASYVAAGWGHGGLPPFSLGYVHIAAGLAMIAGALLSVPWGTRANQRLKPRLLALLFAGLFILLGLRLIWQNGAGLLTAA